MKKGAVINAELGGWLALLRHTDTFRISDSGLPGPANVPCIDLALTYGIPRFECLSVGVTCATANGT